ncbi:sensor domain-containing diguanylate cyclase [Novosphingobium sp. TCA1]|nr:sensor domain-containing diguanylate cyclase [Novosphingobium sp. TCA1]
MSALVTLGVGIRYGRRALAELDGHMALVAEAGAARAQVEELFAMTDMLQAADDHEDAGAVLMASAARLLPDLDGALYVFNNSRDRLDLARSWSARDGFAPPPALFPESCWALKRGKPHVNDRRGGSLCCQHTIGEASTIEVPMMARGQVFGLLVLACESADAHDRLQDVTRIARALADSMSLALSNIALREKLRTQSLRDPLTGLYNRRYMEDALERYINLAQRTGTPISVLMIDLDNFKRLNDDHGHAKGDAVLRDVAGQLVGTLRPSDVIARYGGEELLVIMPKCSLGDAAAKAELLRQRIEALSAAHGAQVSASFGIATVPETATGAGDVVTMADSALYAAKQSGKNRVVTAPRRAARGENARESGTPLLTAAG